jgi:hypothetical protein
VNGTIELNGPRWLLETRNLRRALVSASRWPEWLTAALGLFALVFVLFIRILFRPGLMVVGSDFVQFYFWEYFTRQELAAGRLPLWNPYFLAGYPALANPQTLAFYLPALALRLLPLGYSFGVGIMLHVWWAGLGMYWLTRHQQLGRAASFVSAISFMMSGVVVAHIEGGHLEWVYTIAWLPWVLWWWQKALSDSGLSAPVVAGLVTAMMFLGGGPRLWVCAMVMLALLGLGWLVGLIRRANWREVWQGMARVALGVGVLLGMVAPQLLPTLEFTALSTRSAGVPAACAVPFSLNVSDLAYVALARAPLVSFLDWERNGYFGALALILALAGCVSGWRAAAEWKTLNLIWAAAGILVGLGSALPFFRIAYALMPGFSFIRQPFTLIVLPCFAGAALAGGGLQALLDHGDRHALRLWLTAALCIAALAADAVLIRSLDSDITRLRQLFDLVISLNTPRYLLAALALTLLANPPIRRLAVTFALSVLALDVGLFAFRHIPLSPESTLIDRPAGMPAVDAAEARIVTFPYMHSVGSTYTHTANAQGYTPMILESYASFVRGSRPAKECQALGYVEMDPADTQLLRLLSVKYIATVGAGAEGVADYYPRALWAGQAEAVDSVEEAIALGRAGDYDPTEVIYLELTDHPASVTGRADSRGSARITTYLPQQVVIEVNAPASGWVYLDDVWYPGWQAKVNGRSTPLYRANGAFRAVPVPAGQAIVEMTYQSTYLNAGVGVALATFVTVALLVWMGRRRQQGGAMQG